MIGAAEVGSRIVLPLLDDRAADVARASKQVEQCLAVTPPDSALKLGQILGETA